MTRNGSSSAATENPMKLVPRAADPYLRIILCISISVLLACSKPESASQAAAPPQEVMVVKAVSRSIPIITEEVGQTRAVQTVEVRSRVDGTLEKIAFEEGRIISQGDLMFVIDRLPLEAALAQAKASLMQARAAHVRSRQELARVRPLAQEDAVSQQELEAAIAQQAGDQASGVAAQAAVVQAQLNLGYTTISAPISGLVGSTEMRVGSLVDRSQTLLATISNLDSIYVTYSVSERTYLEWVKRHPGETVGGGEAARAIEFHVVLANDSLYPHPGTFDIADRTIDPMTGTLRVRVKLPNPDEVLRPGQFVRVRYAARENPDAIMIPQRAVQEIQGKRSVYLAGSDGKAEFRNVVIGEQVGNDIIIEQGVSAGDTVIVDGVQKIRPGAAVKPVPLAASSPEPSPSRGEGGPRPPPRTVEGDRKPSNQ